MFFETNFSLNLDLKVRHTLLALLMNLQQARTTTIVKFQRWKLEKYRYLIPFPLTLTKFVTLVDVDDKIKR